MFEGLIFYLLFFTCDLSTGGAAHIRALTHMRRPGYNPSHAKNDLVSKYHAPQGYHYSGWVVLQGDTPGSVHNKSERSENSFFLSKPNTFKYQGGLFFSS